MLGIALIATTYTYMLTWTYTGEVNAKRIREQYLKAILRQDIAYFDNVRPNPANRFLIPSPLLSIRSAQGK